MNAFSSQLSSNKNMLSMSKGNRWTVTMCKIGDVYAYIKTLRKCKQYSDWSEQLCLPKPNVSLFLDGCFEYLSTPSSRSMAVSSDTVCWQSTGRSIY